MLRGAWKLWALGAASLAAAAPAFAVPQPGGVDFQTPVTETAQRVHAFHVEVLVIITAITAFVTALRSRDAFARTTFVCTGPVRADAGAQFLRAGFAAYVAKPFSVRNLLDAMPGAGMRRAG